MSPRRRPGETVAVRPQTKAALSPRARAFDPGAAEDAQRSGPKRVRWADMHWEVACDQCPVWLARTVTETTARALAAAHAEFRPGHTADARHLGGA